MIAAICFGLVVLAQPPQKVDYRQPQSAPRPTPEWARLVDLGEKNPELRGYQAVAGLKVEVVAREPVVVNPVGMTFDDQGTLYVLEWLAEAGGNSWPETKETVTYRDGSKREFATMKKKV